MHIPVHPRDERVDLRRVRQITVGDRGSRLRRTVGIKTDQVGAGGAISFERTQDRFEFLTPIARRLNGKKLIEARAVDRGTNVIGNAIEVADDLGQALLIEAGRRIVAVRPGVEDV